jgi:hypothetical protein
MNNTLTTFDALETAIEALLVAASKTDTASPQGSKIRAAITTLEMIRDQKGCEHFDRGCNGPLTDLIDIIVFG